MNDIKTVLTAAITDLVKQKGFSQEVITFENGKWNVKRTFLGLQDGAAYQDDQQLIHGIVEAAMNKYVQPSGLRQAAS